ncbi:hypothetical protein GH714_035814 [Hevea brasiliensis]|uniref:Uncharacterized protein n=1 Tax=Hevea brasiliensis TaxID=3981 RepID=A0A6A6KSA6_HEVBR|nr:hypothetical protein GH714_035814 [Hevea brasiliensis]
MNGPNAAATALGVGMGVGVIPLLTAAPCLAPQNMDDQDLFNNGRNKISGIQFWQNQTSSPQSIQYKENCFDLDHNNSSVNLLQSVNNTSAGGGLGGNSASSGQQRVKIVETRPRKIAAIGGAGRAARVVVMIALLTSKARGYRRPGGGESQLMAAAAGGGAVLGLFRGQETRLINSKPPQLLILPLLTLLRQESFDTSPVTKWRMVKMEYAYQAVVKIGGHVFKGFLYDQGVEGRDGFPNISELHLGGASSSGGGDGGGRNGASSSSPLLILQMFMVHPVEGCWEVQVMLLGLGFLVPRVHFPSVIALRGGSPYSKGAAFSHY